jgi:hypothetical protein
MVVNDNSLIIYNFKVVKMNALDNILEEFFKDLKVNQKVPDAVIYGIKELIQKDKFSSEELLKIIIKNVT